MKKNKRVENRDRNEERKQKRKMGKACVETANEPEKGGGEKSQHKEKALSSRKNNMKIRIRELETRNKKNVEREVL